MSHFRTTTESSGFKHKRYFCKAKIRVQQCTWMNGGIKQKQVWQNDKLVAKECKGMYSQRQPWRSLVPSRHEFAIAISKPMFNGCHGRCLLNSVRDWRGSAAVPKEWSDSRTPQSPTVYFCWSKINRNAQIKTVVLLCIFRVFLGIKLILLYTLFLLCFNSWQEIVSPKNLPGQL